MANTKPETVEQKPETAKQKPETVKIKLQKDRNKNSLPQFVGINGNSYLIPRGVWVEVPYEVSEILRMKEEQEDRAMETIDRLKTD